MRVVSPDSLLLVTLTHNDDPNVVVLGPFTTINSMDDKVTGEPYPHGRGRPDTVLVYFCTETKTWWSTKGRRIIGWTAQSVAEALVNGHHLELAKANYVVREFS